MPEIRELTPKELQGLENQGIDSSLYKGKKYTLATDKELPSIQSHVAKQPSNNEIGIGQTIGRTALAHGGGYVGGGAGALGFTTLAAPWLAGPEVGIPADIAMLGGTAIAGMLGGYGGQKAQNALQGEEVTKRLQLEAEAAAEQHPIISGATDIGASMLAGGGKPSLSILPKALKGEANATRTIIGNALLNPAINTGLNYAVTGELPSGKELLAQAASGLVTDNAKWASRLTGHGNNERPSESNVELTTTPEPVIGEQQGPTSPYKHTIGENNEPFIDDKGIRSEYNRLINSKPNYDNLSSTEKQAARSQYDRGNKIPVDEMRQQLHDKWLNGLENQPIVKLPDKIEEKHITPLIEEKVKTEELTQEEVNKDLEEENKNLKFAPKEQRDILLAKAKELMSNGQSNTQEFRDIWQQIEDIRNTNVQNTRPLEDILSQHLTDNPQATVKSTLQHIASTKSEWQPLANHILNNASPEKLTVPIIASSGEGRSNYDTANKQINLEFKHADNPSVVIHEIGHAITSNNLPVEFKGLRGEQLKSTMDKYLADPSNNPHVKELINSYYEAAKNLNLHDSLFTDIGRGQGGKAPYVRGLAGAPDEAYNKHGLTGYAMGDLHEFTSMLMGDKDFQAKLNEMPSGLSDGKSLWSRIVEAIRNILGVPVKENSLLERALKASDEIIKTPGDGEQSNEKKFSPPTTSAAKEEKPSHLGWFGNITRSMVDKISDINHPGAKVVSDAIKKTLNEVPQRYGKTGNKIVEAGQKLTPEDKVQIKKIFDYENLHDKAAPSSMFTSNRQREFYKIEREVYKESGEFRINNNEPVLENGKPRQLIQKPFAHPTTPNQQVAEIYKSNTDVNKIASLDKEFLDNLSKHGYASSKAKEALATFKESLQGDLRNTASNMQYYNAARKAQGIPLPDSFTRTDPVKNLEAYYNRQAVDNSFYKNVESKHDVLGFLGADKDAWNNPVTKPERGSIANNTAVKNALQEFHGHSGGPGFHNERALSSLATTLFISNPALEVHKLGSNVISLISTYADNPSQMVRIASAMVSNFKQGIQHATENGLHKLSARSISDAFDSTATAAEKMQSVASTIRKISSINGLSDKLSNGLMQAGAEAVIPQKIQKANAGDKTSQALLTKLDPDYRTGKQYSKEDISKLSSTLASYIHGTGDGRTMPAWMASDTEFSGFFKLAHWSIAQTNRFISDVYQPALKGNYTPLITSLFGSAIGGYLIKEIREKIQGKHGQLPSLDEIASSEGGLAGHKSLVAYNMIAGAQYAGFGGLLSQLAKYPFDFAYKNNPQGATFPLDEISADMAKTLGEVSSAIANDKNINWFELASHVAGHILSTDVQLSRVGINQAINNGLITGTVADKKLLSDKMGKLRRFEEIEGLPYAQQGAQAANPYMDLELKKFRTTQDLQEAAKMLPQLIYKIMEQYHDNPDVMMSKLKTLKEHSYNTMPNMENLPLSYMKYFGYLQRHEGNEAASNVLKDYLQHKMIGEAKASMVP